MRVEGLAPLHTGFYRASRRGFESVNHFGFRDEHALTGMLEKQWNSKI